VSIDRRRRRRLISAVARVLVAAPLLVLAGRAALGRLGADPVETLTHGTGLWALRFLWITLTVSPARRVLGWSWAAPLRRTFGLAAFAYALLHLSIWVVLDNSFDLGAMGEDVVEHRWVTAGMAAFLCMLPLAMTSSDRMIKRLGRRWPVLHRLVYVAAVAAAIHFLWLVKKDLREPLIYAALLSVLIGDRIRIRLRSRAAPRTAP
jgi:sulfoxide reductase heme-binding subunit YedZ